jgi:hypothetical protein
MPTYAAQTTLGAIAQLSGAKALEAKKVPE